MCGAMAGDDVIMLFVCPPAELVAAGAPKQHLLGYERIYLEPKAKRHFVFRVTVEQLRLVAGAPAMAKVSSIPTATEGSVIGNSTSPKRQQRQQGACGKWTFRPGLDNEKASSLDVCL